MKNKASGIRWLWITLIIIVIDQGSKLLALQLLHAYQPFVVLPFFNLTLAFNKGAAFGFLHHASGWQNIMFTALAFSVCSMILLWLYRSSSAEFLRNCALTLILGGALGNVCDRFLYGYVIDFFSFHLGDWHFAIFNVADSAICIGASLLILHWFLTSKEEV